jgi:uncharacterized cupredoxin-like copper-binding protein
MRQFSSRLGRPAVVVWALLAATGCSAGETSTRPQGALVRVTERDFHIAVTPARVRAGDVRLVVRNQGPDTHELIIVRSRQARPPLRLDGLTVDEEALHKVTVAVVDGAGPGALEHLRLNLAPGRYELFCNMAGHFMAGMYTELVVE